MINAPTSVPTNALTAFAFFVGKGLTPAQSAGIVGNLIQESGVDPNSVGDGGAGIAGWTPPSQLYNYAQSTGQPANSLSTQLNYLWSELNSNESASLTALKTAQSPSQAAVIFQNKFERCLGSNTADPNTPGGCNQNNRVNNANAVYTAATGKNLSALEKALGTNTNVGANGSGTSSSSSSGTNGCSNCAIGWTWPSVAGIGGGNVCVWCADWTKNLLGGLLIGAAGVVGIAALFMMFRAEATPRIVQQLGGTSLIRGVSRVL